MKLTLRLAFLLCVLTPSPREALAQATVFFYCPVGAFPSGVAELKDGTNRIAILADKKTVRYVSTSGQKIFVVVFQGISRQLKVTVDDGATYFVKCHFNGSAPRFDLEDFAGASPLLPVSISDSIESVMIASLGAHRLTSIALNAAEIQNLNPIVKNDSLLVAFEERYPLFTGEKSKTLEDLNRGNGRALMVSSQGITRELKSPGRSNKIIWGTCRDGTTYYSRRPGGGMEKTPEIGWTGMPQGVGINQDSTIDGKYLGSWTEGNTLYIASAGKGKRVLRITTLLNGKISSFILYPIPFVINTNNREDVQFISTPFDFDDPSELALTKLYLRPGRLYITQDDQGLLADGNSAAKSIIAEVNLKTGKVKNHTFFPGDVAHGGLQTSIAGPYSIWLLKDAAIKIHDLETGKELSSISLSDQLSAGGSFLRRYDKLRPEYLRERVRSSRINFVTGEVGPDGALILRVGSYTVQGSPIINAGLLSPLSLAVTATSIAIRAARDKKIEVRYFYLKGIPGGKFQEVKETATLQQKVDQLELMFVTIGYSMADWNYAFSENSIYAVYVREHDTVLRVYRVER